MIGYIAVLLFLLLPRYLRWRSGDDPSLQSSPVAMPAPPLSLTPTATSLSAGESLPLGHKGSHARERCP